MLDARDFGAPAGRELVVTPREAMAGLRRACGIAANGRRYARIGPGPARDAR